VKPAHRRNTVLVIPLRRVPSEREPTCKVLKVEVSFDELFCQVLMRPNGVIDGACLRVLEGLFLPMRRIGGRRLVFSHPSGRVFLQGGRFLLLHPVEHVNPAYKSLGISSVCAVQLISPTASAVVA
jgi:hypothetical protein